MKLSRVAVAIRRSAAMTGFSAAVVEFRFGPSPKSLNIQIWMLPILRDRAPQSLAIPMAGRQLDFA
jgi:hypothetical protein